MPWLATGFALAPQRPHAMVPNTCCYTMAGAYTRSFLSST